VKAPGWFATMRGRYLQLELLRVRRLSLVIRLAVTPGGFALHVGGWSILYSWGRVAPVSLWRHHTDMGYLRHPSNRFCRLIDELWMLPHHLLTCPDVRSVAHRLLVAVKSEFPELLS
jgi:hypothetical protein